MKELHLENVQEATEGVRLPAGGYICGIVGVTDNEGKEYLDINYDIVEGDFKGYYKKLNETFPSWWGGRLIRSYKDKALPFFKAFITSVEKSNQGYKFKESEYAKLKGKKIGLVLSEEEYKGNDGTIKTRLYVSAVHSVGAIKSGEYEIKPLKIYEYDDAEYPVNKNASTTVQFTETTDDDYPF